MVKIPLTQGKFALVDDCDAHLSGYSWHARKHRNTWYAVKDLYGNGKPVKRKLAYLHHCVVGHSIKGLQVDHFNGDGLDDRKQNLRFVTNRENCQNRHYHRNGSHLIGITFDKRSGKWESKIRVNGKRKFLGYYDNANEASLAYQNYLSSSNLVI